MTTTILFGVLGLIVGAALGIASKRLTNESVGIYDEPVDIGRELVAGPDRPGAGNRPARAADRRKTRRRAAAGASPTPGDGGAAAIAAGAGAVASDGPDSAATPGSSGGSGGGQSGSDGGGSGSNGGNVEPEDEPEHEIEHEDGDD